MAIKPLRKFSTSLVIREMQIKALGTTPPPLEWLKLRLKARGLQRCWCKFTHLYCVNWYTCIGNQFASKLSIETYLLEIKKIWTHYEVKHTVTIYLTVSLLGNDKSKEYLFQNPEYAQKFIVALLMIAGNNEKNPSTCEWIKKFHTVKNW